LRLQLGLRRRRPHRLPALRRLPVPRPGHVAGLPDPRHRRVRLAGLQPRHQPDGGRPDGQAPERHRPAVPGLVEQQAGAGLVGRYDDDAAVTLMDAWWPRLLEATYKPALGLTAYGRLKDMLVQGEPNVGQAATSEPSFSDGWYGYVNKDLRTMFNKRKPRGRFSRGYCGNGSRTACRRLLRRTLRDALGDPPQQLYGYADCAKNPQASCFD